MFLPPSLSESCRSNRVASNAGNSPKIIPVSSETPSVKRSTGVFILTLDGAGNEKLNPDGADPVRQGLQQITDQLGTQSNEQDCQSGIKGWIGMCLAHCDRVHLSMRLIKRDAGVESADGAGEEALSLMQLF